MLNDAVGAKMYAFRSNFLHAFSRKINFSELDEIFHCVNPDIYAALMISGRLERNVIAAIDSMVSDPFDWSE